MSERTTKRPAGATRVTTPETSRAGDPALAAIDVTGFTREQLERALADRGLSRAGSDEQLRVRLSTDVSGT